MQKLLTLVTSAYRSERYLVKYFQNISALANFGQIEVILVVNDATPMEQQIADQFKQRFPENITLLYVPRESIGASTNRGYYLAKTEYIAYADVDDIRFPDCYERQLKTLESNPNVDFTYGDFFAVRHQGERRGKYISVPEFDRNEFARSSFTGSNQLFRRRLLERCGYWDEQLLSGGDFEFQIRAAANATFKKTGGGPLACYTRGLDGTSASSGQLQPIERTVIELRYGIYDKIDYRYYEEAMKYRIHEIKDGNQWIPVSRRFPGYEQFLKEREYLIPIGKRKHFLRRIVRQPIKRSLQIIGVYDRALRIVQRW
jgi:glycosyltransferase involved in cell wall biosynthesis